MLPKTWTAQQILRWVLKAVHQHPCLGPTIPRALPAFAECSLVNCLVWLVQRERLLQLLARRDFKSIFRAGALHLITGHSSDRRRVYVKPSSPLNGEGKHEQCACAPLADYSDDIHRCQARRQQQTLIPLVTRHIRVVCGHALSRSLTG